MSMESVRICSTGLHRKVNQDRAAAFIDSDYGLFLIADGMGGHFAGDFASQTILESYTVWWDKVYGTVASRDIRDIVEELRDVLDESNWKIFEATPKGRICGSTLTVLFIHKQRFALLSVGDSRCYQISRSFPPRIRQITQDDVGRKGGLTRAVGSRQQCGCQMQTGSVPPKTLFALCSDGVYKYCPEKLWKRSLKKASLGGALWKTLDRISDGVLKNGAGDNYSLILVRT